MSVIARKIAASPKRTAVEVWEVICKILSKNGSDARQTLESIEGVAAAIISDEILKDVPIILSGNGPRVRIYCVYGDAALEEDNSNEVSLPEYPTLATWHMYIPCNLEDITWVKASLANFSDYVSVYDKDKVPDIENNSDFSASLNVDRSNLLNKL